MKVAGVCAVTAVALVLADASAFGQTKPRDYPVKPVPFTAVHFNDAFWAPRIEVNRQVTIPFALEKCEETKRVYNFERAAKVLRGEPLLDKTPPGYPFDDTDLYKVIEGAAYALSVHPDPKLESYLDVLIAKIAAAQEEDGYLYTTRTIDPQNPHRWAGKNRWEKEKVDGHELYNLGHLYEAAVAHYQATGKRTLLDVAIRSADLLDRTFGPGKQSIWPGHPITEMGLVKLCRATGEPRYLNLAKFMLDVRGPDGSEGAGRQYNQSHKKVVEQDEAVGHAVRGFRPRLRPAEHERVQRDLRRDRQRLLEPSAVPAPRRRQASWRVLYKDGEEWEPVETTEPYGVAKDQYNKVRFKAVTTGGLRIEAKLQPLWSAGIQEWKVN